MVAREQVPQVRRVAGVDVARGMAALIMIQGHGYDAFVSPEAKLTTAYAVTRLLGTFPLPAYLVLAGASLALRFRIAEERDEPLTRLKRKVLFRSAQLVLIGYLLQLLFAVMDGWDSVDTLLRADVLQCIGLSLGILGLALPSKRSSGASEFAGWQWRVFSLGVLATLLCPPLTQFGATVTGLSRYVLAPWIDIPGVTRMPLVPLFAWSAGGMLVTSAWLNATPAPLSEAPPRKRPALALLLAAGCGACLAAQLTLAWLPEAGLTRAHPIVWLNVLDLFGRGVCVLAAGILVAGWLPSPWQSLLMRLGRGSLWAYVAHLPFCYGRLGSYVAGTLTMLEATVAVAVLIAIGYGASVLQPSLRSFVRKVVIAHFGVAKT